MNCRLCGSALHFGPTDLPFKVSDGSIVILKDLPVHQCASCSQYLIEDAVFERVERLLAAVGPTTELRVVRYTA